MYGVGLVQVLSVKMWVILKRAVIGLFRKKPPVQYVRCEIEGCGTVLAHPRYLQVCVCSYLMLGPSSAGYTLSRLKLILVDRIENSLFLVSLSKNNVPSLCLVLSFAFCVNSSGPNFSFSPSFPFDFLCPSLVHFSLLF